MRERRSSTTPVSHVAIPAAALGMLIFMLALAGIPPTAGFMGKLYLFAAAVEGGYVLLTLIAVIMSAVSLYYYFRIVVQMYLQDGEEEGAEPAELLRDRWTEAMIAVCIVATMVIGVWPSAGCGLGQECCRCSGHHVTAGSGRRLVRSGRWDADKKQLRRARLWLDVSIIGIQFPVAIALGFFFGRWLDGQFNTHPWMTMIFALFGIAAGFINLFRITAQASRAEEEIGSSSG